MKTLTLTAPWGGHPADTVLEILGPGDALGPRRVDPRRAAVLVARGLAEPEHEEATAETTHALRRELARGRKKKGA